MLVAHHTLADVDQQRTDRAWQSWLNQVFARATGR
jgi:hypothetical protein